jgi:hypothetical protein
VDRAAGGGPRAQPAGGLCGELRPLPQAWLRRAGEPLHAGALPPLRRGVVQLRAERDFAGGHICGCLRGVSGDPSQLGALDTPLPRGALHAAHDGAEDPTRGARRRDVARPAGAVQGRLHPLHHDDEQHRLGAGWFYLRNAEPGLPL